MASERAAMSIEAIKQMVDALRRVRSRIVQVGGSGWKLEAQLCANALEAGSQAIADLEKQEHGKPLAWINEDELPESYPYDAIFPYSKVDVVRVFPVFGPQPNKLTDAKSLSLELLGVITDIEQGNGFDDVCLQTIKRVYSQLSAKCAGKT